MIALSEEAIRSSDPIEHYVLSWREGERPTPQHIEKAVDILMGEFGMRESDKFGMNEHRSSMDCIRIQTIIISISCSTGRIP